MAAGRACGAYAGRVPIHPPPPAQAQAPPATPSSVTVTRANGTLTASGYAVSGATKYHITYSSDGKQSWSLASSNHTGTSITISDVDDSKAYVVGVRAGNANGWSGWRNSTPIHAASPPSTPSTVTVTRANGTLTASGYAVSGATKYHITYSTDGGASWHAPVGDHTNWTAASITFSADNSKTYIVGVRAGNDHGWSGWRNSPSSSAVAQSSPPATPSTVTVSRSSGTLSVSDYSVSDATKYHIRYSSDGGASWSTASNNQTERSMTIRNVDDAKTYVVAVRAGNDSGWSGWRNSASIGPFQTAPDAVSAVYFERGDGSIFVTWPSVSNATKYGIRYQSTDQQGWSTASDNYRWPFIIISGTDNTKTYRFSVRAGNAQGWSSWTESALSPPSDPIIISPIPDPIPQVTLAASGVTNSGATLTIGGEHTGAWWYQRMLPTGDNTCHSAGSSATATLTGLTGDTYHQYDAYNRSGCGGADLVATARFTTSAGPPSLSITNIGATSATLNIANHNGNWYYKANTGPDATCQGPVSGSSEDLTGLSAHTSYDYSAYSDSTCTTANELASAPRFITLSSVSNLSSTKAVGQGAIYSGGKIAVAFSISSTASSSKYILKSVTMPLKNIGAQEDGLVVKLHAMEGTGAYSSTSKPDDDGILATLSGASPTSSSWTDLTYECSGSGCKLDRGKTYFVVLTTALAPDAYAWAYATTETEVALPSNNGWSVGFGHYKTLADWTSYSDWSPAEFVFAHAPSLASSSVTTTGATLTIANHSGNWYYQANTGPDSSCSSTAQTGTTLSLSGLTGGTTYTYTAYDKSGCNSADEIASVTFTTTVSVGNLSETKSADGQVGQWRPALNDIIVKRAAGFTTGSNSSGYSLQSVTAKFSNKVGSPSGFTAAIHAASSGSPAASATCALSGSAPDTAGEYTYTPSATCDLSASTTYFLVLSASGAAGANHYYLLSYTSSSSQTNTPSNAGWTIADKGKVKSGNDNWADEGTTHVPMFKVTALPKSASSSSLVGGSASSLSGRVAQATGASKGASESGTASGAFAGASESGAASSLPGYVSSLSSAPSGGTQLKAGDLAGVAFTTGPHPHGYTLDSFTATLAALKGEADLVWTLHEQAGDRYGADSQPSPTARATLTGTAPTAAEFTDLTYTCAGDGCVLAPDTTYFVVAESVGSGVVSWAFIFSSATLSETAVPANNGWSLGHAHYSADGVTWATFQDWQHTRLDFTPR